MQTVFSPEQLADPHVAHSESILRKCVHCGFCTATCPTYLTLGDELDSPRGRIYLIKDVLENGKPADERFVKHIDRCLSCLACMTTCPSGRQLHAPRRSCARPHPEDLPAAIGRPRDPLDAVASAAIPGPVPGSAHRRPACEAFCRSFPRNSRPVADVGNAFAGPGIAAQGKRRGGNRHPHGGGRSQGTRRDPFRLRPTGAEPAHQRGGG